MRTKRLAWKVFLAVALVSLPASIHAQELTHPRPRIGLVLEGGGALGFAHIGVLEYLEEHHIPVDLVVGTSMGGLVGGLYAIGNTPAEIRQFTDTINWSTVLSGATDFEDLSFRRKEDNQAFPNRLELGLKHGLSLPLGLNSGFQVGLLLARETLAYPRNINFNDLPVPFRCVATDITLGRKKVFDRGSLTQALRATMSIPAVFSPVNINGHLYTDGLAVDNLPVDVAKQAGADLVIAVYLDSGPPDPKGYDSLFAVASQNVSIMISSNELRNMQAADILVSADVRGFSSASFTESEEIIPKGYAAAQKKQQVLAGLALTDKEWEAYVAQRNSKKRTTIPIPQFIQVVGDKTNYIRTLQQSLAEFVGKPVDPAALIKPLTRITGTGVISSATYSIAENNGVPGLQVNTYDKAYAPPFLDLAVNIDGSDPDNVLFGLAARLTFMDLGGYRAEWRNDAFFGSTYGVHSEYYRPFTGSSKWFFAPDIYAISSPFNIYSGQNRLAQYRIERDGVGLDLGYALSTRSEIRLGEDLLLFKTIKKIAADIFPNISERQAVAAIRYRYFGVDNIELPRQGLNVDFNVSRYQSQAGTADFSQSEVRASYFQRISEPGSLIFAASAGTSFKTPSYQLLLHSFSLGGPLRLGAYGENELLAGQYFLLQTGYEHKLLSFNPLVGEGLYALALLEGAKVYQPLNVSGNPAPIDGSLALVARTSFGPVFIGTSVGSGGHRKWWFGVGRIF